MTPELLAVDGQGDRLPDARVMEPRQSCPGRVGEVEPQEIGVRSDAGVVQDDKALVGGALERTVVLRPDLGIGHEVDLAGSQWAGLARSFARTCERRTQPATGPPTGANTRAKRAHVSESG